MIRFAVLGCGRIGSMHAKNIAAHPRATLSAIHDIHAPAALAIGSAMGAFVASSVAQAALKSVALGRAVSMSEVA